VPVSISLFGLFLGELDPPSKRDGRVDRDDVHRRALHQVMSRGTRTGGVPGGVKSRPYGTESQDREEAPLFRWLASAGQGLVCRQIDGGVMPQASSASLVAVSTEAAMWSRALSSESSGGIGKGSA